MPRLLRILAPRWGLSLASIACMAAVAGTTVAYAFLAGPLLRAMRGAGHPGMGALPEWVPGAGVVGLAATLLAVTVARAVASYAQRILAARVGQDVVRRLRLRMYSHLLHAVPSVLTTQKRGELAARLSNDVLQIQTLLASNLTALASDLVTLGALVALAFALDVELACVALAAIPLIALIVWRLAGFVRRAQREVWARYGELSGHAAELVDAMPVIRAYGAESQALLTFGTRAHELEERSIAAQRWSAFGSPLVQVLGGVALVSALVLSADRLASGALPAETFVSFFAAMFFVYRPVQGLGATVHRVASGFAALDRVGEILALPIEPEDRPEAVVLDRMRLGLLVEDVRFEHPGGPRVLDGVSLELRPGESVAVVGASGQGKTTLLRVMLGLLRADGGSVRIDGVEIGDATRESWRRQLAWVTQEPFLFADTVRANVAVADPDPDDARVMDALRGAGALELLARLPEGLDTILTEAGRALSGGERQRLCIARALYRDCPVLLFDEATSSLDPASEAAIAKTIEGLMGERTVVLVSHRLGTILRADRVLVLEGGRIVETGSPQALWNTGGRFAALFSDERLP